MEYQPEVLIADSSAAFSGQLQQELQQGDRFRVCGVVSRSDLVLELVVAGKPDLLVLDLSLPGPDVLQVLRRIRELEVSPDILVLTNYISGYVFRYLVSLGVSYFLCKPCAVETVIDHLDRICLRRFPRMAAVKTPKPEDFGAEAGGALRQMGVSPNLKGYHDICRAVELAIADPSILSGITKTLYPQLARESHTTPDRVERNIRTAVDAAWRRSSGEVRLRYFGACAGVKPTNTRFIENLARYLQLRHADRQNKCQI